MKKRRSGAEMDRLVSIAGRMMKRGMSIKVACAKVGIYEGAWRLRRKRPAVPSSKSYIAFGRQGKTRTTSPADPAAVLAAALGEVVRQVVRAELRRLLEH